MCRSRRELSNAYLLAKIGVDTAENEPLDVWGENSIQYSLHSLAGTLDGWRRPEDHTSYNGFLVRRPFHGRWDAHGADVEKFHARFQADRLALTKRLAARAAVKETISSVAAVAEISALLRAAALPAALSEQIHSDACSLAGVVGAMYADRELEVKLEVASEKPCIRWHTDCFVGRTIVTYTGSKGTEYTSDCNVNFLELSSKKDNEQVIRDIKKVKSVDVGDILFMKGKYEQKYGHGGNPLVHRSPDPQYDEDGRFLRRLLLKVDVPLTDTERMME